MNKVVFLNFVAVTILLTLLSSTGSVFVMPKFDRGLIHEKIHLLTHTPVPVRTPARFTATKPHNSDTIILVGDVMLSRNVEFLSLSKGTDYPYRGFDFSSLAINPYLIANFESSIPEVHIPTEALQMTFSVNPDLLESFKQAGFSHTSLANNHSYDYGEEGYTNAVKQLTEAGVTTFGNPDTISADAITYLQLNKKTVALIGLYALVHTPSDQELKALFSEASKNSDFQIVYIHWGEEYQTKNNRTQKDLAARLVHNGADLIIGHHPHVVQNIDLIEGVPVFYSLGNYIFDQYFSTETETGLLVQLDFNQNTTINIIPVTSLGTLSQPHLMNPVEHYKFLADLAQNSAPELSKQITSGTITLDSRVATSAKIAMMN